MCSPTFPLFVQVNAAILRRAAGFVYEPVAPVLAMRSQAEIFPAIIEAIAVFMVNHKASGRVHNFGMHRNDFGYVIGAVNKPNSVKETFIFYCAPLEIIETVEVLRVNYCKFALGEANLAKGIAILTLPVSHHRPRIYSVKPIRNPDC
jgi:hypothetical protein